MKLYHCVGARSFRPLWALEAPGLWRAARYSQIAADSVRIVPPSSSAGIVPSGLIPDEAEAG
jgi:hypothetical protein